jgi:hypothetical protein
MCCKRTAALALAAVALLAAGCGKKGDPEPPFRNIPQATSDLSALQRGEEVVLRFGYPKTTAAGRPLAGLDRVEVWEVVRPAPPAPPPAEPPPAPPPLDSRELAGAAVRRLEVTGEGIAAATQGDRIVLHLPLAAPLPAEPQVRYLAVRTGAGRELSAYSNQAVLLTFPPPAGPNAIEARAQADGVEVGWSGGAAEGEVEGHHVYRRDAEVRELGEPLGFVPRGERSYFDPTARYGRRYIYAVTAVARRAPRVESAVAAAREVDYRDRFPPPAPADLVALADPGRVRLVWSASDAVDLAGYRVSRRRGEGDWEALTAEPVRATELIDAGLADLAAGETVAYRVTAVDELGNESAPSEAAATVPP